MFKRPVFFYGWIMIGITGIGMTLVYSSRNTFSVFFPPILDEFGWSRGSTAIMLSLNLFIYGLLAPVAGSLADRYQPRRVMLIGITVLGLATAGCAFASELWQFYLFFGVMMPLGAAFSGWPLLSPTLANWFVKRRGLAMSLGNMGASLSFVYTIFAAFVISHLGWRSAFLVLAGVLVAIMWPLYRFFFYYRPEDRGLKAYGTDKLPGGGLMAEAVIGSNMPSRDWTLGRAMKTYQLWFLVLAFSLYWGMGAYLVLAHQVKFVVDVGYDSMLAASVFGLFGISMVAGHFGAPMSDWIGREKTAAIGAALAVGGMVALISVEDTSQPWLLYVYATSFGFGAGLFTPTLFAGAADIFHGRHFGTISGLVLTGMGVSGVIGPWLGGYLYDISGSYNTAFTLGMVSIGLAGVSLWIAAPRNAAKLRAKL